MDTDLLASPVLVNAIIRRFQEVATKRTASIPEWSIAPELSSLVASPACNSRADDLVEAHHSHAVTGLVEQQVPVPSRVALPETVPVSKMLPTPTMDTVDQPVRHSAEEDMVYASAPEMGQHLGVFERKVAEDDQKDAIYAVDHTSESQEEIELIIPPPVDASRLLLLFNRLRDQYHAEILHTVGSREGSTLMMFRLESSIDLREALARMPWVAQVWETELGTKDDKRSLSGVVPLSFDVTEPNERRRFFLKFINEDLQLELPI